MNNTANYYFAGGIVDSVTLVVITLWDAYYTRKNSARNSAETGVKRLFKLAPQRIGVLTLQATLLVSLGCSVILLPVNDERQRGTRTSLMEKSEFSAIVVHMAAGLLLILGSLAIVVALRARRAAEYLLVAALGAMTVYAALGATAVATSPASSPSSVSAVCWVLSELLHTSGHLAFLCVLVEFMVTGPPGKTKDSVFIAMLLALILLSDRVLQVGVDRRDGESTWIDDIHGISIVARAGLVFLGVILAQEADKLSELRLARQRADSNASNFSSIERSTDGTLTSSRRPIGTFSAAPYGSSRRGSDDSEQERSSATVVAYIPGDDEPYLALAPRMAAAAAEPQRDEAYEIRSTAQLDAQDALQQVNENLNSAESRLDSAAQELQMRQVEELIPNSSAIQHVAGTLERMRREQASSRRHSSAS